MEITLAQFVKSLAESGLMIADEVEAFIDRLHPPSALRMVLLLPKNCSNRID